MTMNLLEKLMSIINKQKQAILFSQKDKEIIREISQCNNSYYKTKVLDVLNVNYLTGVMIFQNI